MVWTQFSLGENNEQQLNPTILQACTMISTKHKFSTFTSKLIILWQVLNNPTKWTCIKGYGLGNILLRSTFSLQ